MQLALEVEGYGDDCCKRRENEELVEDRVQDPVHPFLFRGDEERHNFVKMEEYEEDDETSLHDVVHSLDDEAVQLEHVRHTHKVLGKIHA